MAVIVLVDQFAAPDIAGQKRLQSWV